MIVDGRRIIRVFPSKTKATPMDPYLFIGLSTPLSIPDADEVHISVTFTWDKQNAEQLKKLWEHRFGLPVKIGGPAYNEPGGEFIPGLYVKPGYNITSRGCPNKCWFCSVWKREKGLRELEIKDGWIIQDDNLLACSEEHIRAVFDMLRRQPHPAEFRGLEAKLLEQWHIDLMATIRKPFLWFAYDTPDDWEPLVRAAEMMKAAGYGRNRVFCYVLIGWPKDTMEEAQKRLEAVKELGICPFAMLYRGEDGKYLKPWRRFQRSWSRPAAIYAKNRKNMLSD